MHYARLTDYTPIRPCNAVSRCVKAGTHMQTKQFGNSSCQARGKLIFCEPEANIGHTAHPIPFMFAQKIDKFWFAVNSMQSICKQHSAYSQSHPHIRTFGSHVCTSLYIASHQGCVPGLSRQSVSIIVVLCHFQQRHRVSVTTDKNTNSGIRLFRATEQQWEPLHITQNNLLTGVRISSFSRSQGSAASSCW